MASLKAVVVHLVYLVWYQLRLQQFLGPRSPHSSRQVENWCKPAVQQKPGNNFQTHYTTELPGL